MDADTRIRLSAFEHLSRLTMGEPDIPVAWEQLAEFQFEGEKCPLIGQRGIWKPRLLKIPISIATAPPKAGRPAPYEDEIREDDTILYRYQGQDPQSHDNVGLRRALWERKPLIYFHGIDKGIYLAAWPVHVMEERPDLLAFTVNLSPQAVRNDIVSESAAPAYGKQYLFVPTRRRLHQAKFRTRIMAAYERRCAICNLGHERLLDAAHIIPDNEEGGGVETNNGLSLCKIHHAAFDANILGIDPDRIVHVREDILQEVDGPMLRHGIQGMHGQGLKKVPRRIDDQPLRERLALRFERFLSA